MRDVVVFVERKRAVVFVPEVDPFDRESSSSDCVKIRD